MRKFSLREKAKTLLLCVASLNLGFSSELPWLGFIFAAAFVVLLFRYDALRVPVYRKSIAYGLIVPFAIWWVLSPEMEYGMSPWLVFIPAYYLLSLAYLQKRSLGNGGYDVFVLFNGVAVLLLSCFQASRYGVFCNLLALLILMHAYGRPGVKWWKHALFLLFFVQLSVISFGGLKYWHSYGYTRADRAADYFNRHHLMGFDPVVWLGSFESNFVGKYNREVVLRVWDSLPPMFVRAAVYEKYKGGIWKLPQKKDRMLYASRYKVDYAVFETRDSVSSADSSRPVWVQSTIDNFGFVFAPPGAVAIAVKDADSVEYYKSGIFKQGGTRRGDWFYYVPHGRVRVVDDVPDSAYLQVFAPLAGFIDTVAKEIELDSNDGLAVIPRIQKYFLRNFVYSLQIDTSKSRATGRANTNSDPLRVFWATRSGYCEYYATLSVLLLRHMGIPARYVTGFARPEVEPGRPYAIFRRYSSHAWVEYYDGDQWKPFDPTPPLFVVKMERPSWLAMKFETLRARSAHIFHVLRDGEWRLSLTSWQNVVQDILSSTAFYVILGCIALAIIAFQVLRTLRRRKSGVGYAQSVQHWVKGLESTEKSLARLGLVRHPGETVGTFLARCANETPKTEKERARLQSALKFLRDYEANRWRL